MRPRSIITGAVVAVSLLAWAAPAAGVSPGRLYDRNGNLVGQEETQFLTNQNALFQCNTPEGLTENNFSTVIELFAN